MVFFATIFGLLIGLGIGYIIGGSKRTTWADIGNLMETIREEME